MLSFCTFLCAYLWLLPFFFSHTDWKGCSQGYWRFRTRNSLKSAVNSETRTIQRLLSTPYLTTPPPNCILAFTYHIFKVSISMCFFYLHADTSSYLLRHYGMMWSRLVFHMNKINNAFELSDSFYVLWMQKCFSFRSSNFFQNK